MEKNKLKNFKGKSFHFIGIGGASMSAMAMMLKKNGFAVQGSDDAQNDMTEKLTRAGIKVFFGHDRLNIAGANVVVYSSAISEDNIELVAARERGLVVIKRAELLGIIASDYNTVISVAGSHGKTTTTAMISEIFLHAKKNPTLHIGGVLKTINSNYKIGGKKFFITENCEYKDNFLNIYPDISVVLNVDSDHLDYFGSLEGVKKSFSRFLQNTKSGGVNIISNDDENSKDFMKLENSLSFGIKNKSDIMAKNIREYRPCYFEFDVVFCKCKLGKIRLNIVGKHNIYNALASIYVGLLCGIDFCDIKDSLEMFSGVKRRCEKIGEINQAQIFHDYAHHPEQIKKMIDVGKDLTKKFHGKTIVVFEPHTYSRTKYLLSEFAEELSKADEIILAPVYAAREDESAGVGSEVLKNEIMKKNKNVQIIGGYSAISEYILNIIAPHDVVLVLGAGTIEKLVQLLMK